MPQLDTRAEDTKAAEEQDVQTAEQIREEPAVESAQDKDVTTGEDAIREPAPGIEQGHERPPIEIKAIPKPDSPTPPPELTQTTPPEPEQNKPG